MPANLTPQYHKAEEEYRRAQTPEDELRCLELMLREMPKHKGTDKLQAELKAKISKAQAGSRARQESRQERASRRPHIPRQGAGRVDHPRRPQRRQEPAPGQADAGHAGGRPLSLHHPRAAAGHDAVGRCAGAAHRHAADHGRCFDPNVLGLIRGSDLALLMVDSGHRRRHRRPRRPCSTG